MKFETVVMFDADETRSLMFGFDVSNRRGIPRGSYNATVRERVECSEAGSKPVTLTHDDVHGFAEFLRFVRPSFTQEQSAALTVLDNALALLDTAAQGVLESDTAQEFVLDADGNYVSPNTKGA